MGSRKPGLPSQPCDLTEGRGRALTYPLKGPGRPLDVDLLDLGGGDRRATSPPGRATFISTLLCDAAALFLSLLNVALVRCPTAIPDRVPLPATDAG
jgi:hypothetical protein